MRVALPGLTMLLMLLRMAIFTFLTRRMCSFRNVHCTQDHSVTQRQSCMCKGSHVHFAFGIWGSNSPDDLHQLHMR